MPIPRIDPALIAATTWENNPAAFWELLARFRDALSDMRDADLHANTRIPLHLLAEPMNVFPIGPIRRTVPNGRTFEDDQVFGFECPPFMRMTILGGCACAEAWAAAGGQVEMRADNVPISEALRLDTLLTMYPFSPLGHTIGPGQRFSWRCDTSGAASFAPISLTLWVKSEHTEGSLTFAP